MRTIGSTLAFVYLLFAAAAHAAPLPAEAFGRLPLISDVAISPDGSKLIVVTNSGDQSLMRIISAADGSPLGTPVAAGPNQRIRGVGWAQDDIASFVVSQTLDPRNSTPAGYIMIGGPRIAEFYRAGTLTLSDGQTRLMLDKNEVSTGQTSLGDLIVPIDGDPGYGRMFALTSFDNDAKLGLYRINLKTGAGEIAQTFNPRTPAILLDGKGEEYARTEYTGDGFDHWRLYVKTDGHERLLREETRDTGATPDLSGILADGRLARIQPPVMRDLRVLGAIDPATGNGDVAYEVPKYDLGGTITDPWTRQIVGVEWTGEFADQQHFFDPQLESIRSTLAGGLVGNPRLLSWSRDRSRVVVYNEAPGDVGVYYVFQPGAKSLKRLARTYPEIEPSSLGQIESITYPARDGTPIPAYLTIPPGAAAPGGQPKNLPTIILVHGGPQDRDSAEFIDYSFWPQFLASRGYLVLQPQFRGSTGFGVNWRNAGYKEWGGRMQTDVEDGAAALAASGLADPSKICIMGASYGGYAALAGATLTPNRYACAVSVAGVADINLLFQEIADDEGEDSFAYDYWRKTIGDPSASRDHLRDVSPAQHVDAVRIPILLLHGTHDTVVPIEQTKMMFEKLKAAGKDVRYTTLPGDDHWLSHGSTRTQMLKEIDTFLARVMPAPVQTSQRALPKVPAEALGPSLLDNSGLTTPVQPNGN